MRNFVICLLFSLVAVSFARPQDDYSYTTNEEEYDDLDVRNDSEPEEIGDIIDIPVFIDHSRNMTFVEGDTVGISCKTTLPTQRVVLFKKKKENAKTTVVLFADSSEVFKSNFQEKNLTYSLPNAKRSDAATYFCTYQVEGGDIEISFNVNIQYPPSVKPMRPNKQRVLKGKNVNFECKADGNPKPTITWSRENQVLPSGAKTEEGGSIMFLDVDRHVEGTYVCTAANGVGTNAYTFKKLLVEYAPEIITEKEIVRTGNGDKVELVCIVHARPKATVEWIKEGNESILPEDTLKTVDASHRHSVILTEVTEKDFGTYKCYAENKIGKSSAAINLTDLPRQPHFTSNPTSAEEDQYTLTWETESYYPITEYHLKYRPTQINSTAPWKEASVVVAKADVEIEALKHKMRHTIKDLLPATDYDAVVSVKNQNKWGSVATFKFSTRRESTSPITGGGSIFTLSIGLCISSWIVYLVS